MPANSAQFLRQLSLRTPSTKLYVCPQCRLQQKRLISTSFIERKKEGEEQWNRRAEEIRQGRTKSMLAVLEERGFIHQIAGERDALDKLMIDKRVGIYCGVDPTAPSLHIGHMLPFMALFWMHLYGFHTVSLVGGTTSGIGDPTGRTTDRTKMTTTERKTNIVSIHYQFKKLWMNLELIGRKHGYAWDKHWHREIANNNIWWNNLPFADVIKTLGRGMRMGSLLARDTVKTKLESGSGMSFAEFCYPIMQAWDWWQVYHTKDVQLQIGGADQFGNIVAGVDAVKYLAKNHPHPDVQQPNGVTETTTPYGFTVPLLTTSSGEKFGKSAGNAVWLDHTYTSIFDLYGFFVRTADADVERLLKLFTFLPVEKIKSIVEEHQQQPSNRIAQHTLAREFVELVHGAKSAAAAEEQHRKMFNRSKGVSLADLTSTTEQPSNDRETTTSTPPESLKIIAKQAVLTSTSTTDMHIVLPLCCVEYRPIAQLLHSVGLVASKSEGHRLAVNRGAYIGRTPDDKADMRDAVEYVAAKNSNPLQTMQYLIRDDAQSQKPGEEGILVLRKGKWNVKIVRVVSDDKFKEMLDRGEVTEPPGYREVLSELSKGRAKSANAQRRLDETEQELLTGRAENTESRADTEGPIDLDQSRGNRRSRAEAFNEGQRKGYEYLKSHSSVAADAQVSSPRGSVSDTRRMLHSIERQDDAARVRKMRAEYGPDRRNWPPLQKRAGGGGGGGGGDISTPGDRRSRSASVARRGSYSVPPPAKLGKAEKMALHRRRHYQIEVERERNASQQTEAKREELREMQARRMAGMGLDGKFARSR